MRRMRRLLLITIFLIGCTTVPMKESPTRHIIYPHMDGTIYLVNGDRVEVVNSVVSVTPDVIRIESTMVRTTILMQNVKYLVLYNSDHKKITKELTADNQ